MRLYSFVTTLCLTCAAALAPAADVVVDVAIYGGTSGGVVAAVQAARMGKSVVIIEPGRHLGGMTSGGLSAVDIGDPRTVGGITREFFTRLVARYGKKLAWDEPHKAVGGSGGGTGGAYCVEPHVAEQVFEELVKEAGVTVLRETRLVEAAKEGPRISGIIVAGPDGTRREIAAKMFIDTTYEGDLMAAAGVSHTLTREGHDQYGELLAGIFYNDFTRPRTHFEQPGPNGRLPSGQGVWDRDFPLDPFVRKGDPSSGLLPLINPGEPGTPGEAAPGVQAYCFRLCLTTAADRLPIEPPPGYDPARYEIVARFIEACLANGDDMDLRWFSKHDPVPNDKYDFNTATFGGNLPGASWGWCEASPERRQELFREHEHHQRGLLHFLATDPRVPAKVRADMRRFGLPRDEFRDTGGWPHQLYVREGRRMIGDLVMTQHHACGKRVAADPVSLGTYGIDAHEIRRIVKDGVVTREGKLAEGREGAGPYGISYRSIVPKQAECDNLLVTFALSASHVAFSSIRMEPVFMVSSQTAATAAAMAIDDGVPVQSVEYAKLKPRLVADGQILGMPSPPPKAPKNAAKREDVNGKSYDLVVIGGTPGGIACAVRAAREGLRVLLVNHTRHLGGFITSGAGGWEATYDGLRSPLYGEMLAGAAAYYRDRYGDGSPEHILSMPSKTSRAHIDRAKVEPRVAELLFNGIVEREQSLTVLLGHVVSTASREGSVLRSVTLQPLQGQGTITVSGKVFADAMYEGDLMTAAGVKTQIGRESREKYGEQHGGVIYTKELSREPGQRGFPKAAADGTLNIRSINHSTGEIVAGPHSGEADDSVMAYNYRLILTRDPANRIMVDKPANYDPAIAKAAAGGGFVPNLPNGKVAWNGGRLIGPQNGYPGADWPAREAIAKQYLDAMLMRLWWLQNDPEAPAGEREAFAGYGLTADEFRDNHNVPYEIYVREARRLVGRHVFKEQDNFVAEGIARTPVHADSIAMTDWPMDSVACLPRSVPGSNVDGILFLAEQSRPAQVPYRSILTNEVENLLVPVAISASHVGWGSIRLEPVWMQLGESAGHAAALAVKSMITPATLDPDHLVRKLAASRVMVTFFNDVDVASNDPRVVAAQYFGTKGFFAGYDARLDEPLKASTQAVWERGLSMLREGTLDPADLARQVHLAEAQDSPPTKRTRGAVLDSMWRALPGSPLTMTPVRSSRAAEVDGKQFDLVVIGGTPAGIACAVRAAREGLTTLIVQHNGHLGGMLTNGLMQWDALHGGQRSPIFNEYARMIEDHYRDTYGDHSPQFAAARYTQTHYPLSRFEPSVAERLFNTLVSAESNITTLLFHHPVAVTREGPLVKKLTLREYGTTNDITVSGGTFVDATYEGDLAAVAKVPYRVGRESRDEFGEPHAGKVFINIVSKPGPKDAVEGRLNLHPYAHAQGSIDPTSPHTADGAIQAYNHRFCVSNEPGKIRLPEKPPGYDREAYVHYNRKGLDAGAINGKSSWNSAILPGENHAYPEATWPEREKIIARHTSFALGLMYFLQNDESLPAATRDGFRHIGLPLDEFPDNDNLPYEIYVREARRIVGRKVFTEHDNIAAAGQARPPIHADSIAFTDWCMDSHDCTTDRRHGYEYDGKLILTEESRPAQVPYRCLLPQGIDNLLVPVCLSATHVAWGAVRLEPVWMQIGEAAGFAAALAKQHRTTPGALDADLLVRTLGKRGHQVTFFNEGPLTPAAQYFGTKGFFAGYDARLDAPLTEAVRGVWLDGFEKLKQRTLDAAKLAAAVQAAESKESPATGELRGEALQRLWPQLEVPATQTTPLEKIDIFEAKTGGYMLYRIPGIVVTAKGTVLAYCEARKSASGDWGTIDILLRRSTDGGRTWGEPHRLADVPGPKQKNPVALKQKLATNDEVTYNNCTLFADRAGPVHALFCLEYARCFYLRSDDDGLTWSKPVEITKTFDAFSSEFDWKVLATGPAHGIQLRSGRLVVPVWLSTGTGGHAHRPSVAATIYSDDAGATWHRGDIAVPSTPEWIDPNETVVVELADGRVMLNVRSWSKQHRRLVTTSPDGATDWTKPEFDDALLEPICMASIVRYSLAGEAGARNRILFANPHWLERADGKAQPGFGRDRKNVSVKLSYDEGQTWPVNKSLEAGFSGYSDLAVLPDGTILCFYERGSIDGKDNYGTGRLTVARFNLAWLTE